jgi:CRISPR-associated protein Cas4
MDRFLEGSPLLPISSLGEYVYCPRLFFYRRALHVEAQTQEMLEGKVLHRDVDRPRVEVAGDSTRYYSVNVIAPILGLAGRLDMIEQRGDEIYPVEYKRGRGPASPGVRVQLCAEAMALEEVLGISVTRGYVEFFDSGEREAVPFDAKLRRKTLDAIVTGRSIASRQWVPRAVYGRRKCEPCSLRSTCLPWETMRLLNRSRRGEVEPIGDDLPDGTGVRPSQAE